MTDLIPRRSLELENTLKIWEEAGLVPLEVTEADFMQTITVRHNARTGAAEIQYTKLDGVQAMGLLAGVLATLWRDTFKSELRPSLNSGNAKACVQLEGDTLSVATGLINPARPNAIPTVDAPVAIGMLLAAAFFIAEKSNAPDWNPLEALLQGLQRKVNE